MYDRRARVKGRPSATDDARILPCLMALEVYELGGVAMGTAKAIRAAGGG
jgi:hypothetical protein